MRLEDAVAFRADAFAFFDANDRCSCATRLSPSFFGSACDGAHSRRTFDESMARRDPAQPVRPRRRSGSWIAAAGATSANARRRDDARTRTGDAYLMRDRATRDGGRVMVFTDVTDRRRAEAALGGTDRSLSAQAGAGKRKSRRAPGELSRRSDTPVRAACRRGRHHQDDAAAHHEP